MHVDSLHVYMSVHQVFLQRSEGGTESTGVEVTDGSKLPCGSWE